MSNKYLVSARPYDDYAMAIRNNSPLLAARVAKANGLGADFISEPAIKAIRAFGAKGFREAAEDLATTFEVELREYHSLEEIELAIAGKTEPTGMNGSATTDESPNEQPSDPRIRFVTENGTVMEHHVLPQPMTFGAEPTEDFRPFGNHADVSLLDNFDDGDDTLVDIKPPFEVDPPITDEISVASDSKNQ